MTRLVADAHYQKINKILSTENLASQMFLDRRKFKVQIYCEKGL